MEEFIYVQITVAELSRVADIIGNKFSIIVTFNEKYSAVITYNDGKVDISKDIDKRILYLNKTIDPKYKSVFFRCEKKDNEENRISFKMETYDNILFLVSYPYSGKEKDERILYDERTGLYPNCFVIHNSDIKEDNNDNFKIRKYNRCYTMVYDKCIVNPIFINNESINKMRLSGPWIEASLLYKYVEKYEQNNNLVTYDEATVMFNELKDRLDKYNKENNGIDKKKPICSFKIYKNNIDDNDSLSINCNGCELLSINNSIIKYNNDIADVCDNGKCYIVNMYTYARNLSLMLNGEFLLPLKGCRRNLIGYDFDLIDNKSDGKRFIMFNKGISCSGKDIQFSFDDIDIELLIVNSFKVSDFIFRECANDEYSQCYYQGYINRLYDICID